ncbi:MAG: hypothetical protein IKH51_05170 [Clostridia bacterium]|nr:hypothetical protein [Clostridia bacterium]
MLVGTKATANTIVRIRIIALTDLSNVRDQPIAIIMLKKRKRKRELAENLSLFIKTVFEMSFIKRVYLIFDWGKELDEFQIHTD